MIRTKQGRSFQLSIEQENMDDQTAVLVDELVRAVTGVCEMFEARFKDEDRECGITVHDRKHLSYRDDTGPF